MGHAFLFFQKLSGIGGAQTGKLRVSAETGFRRAAVSIVAHELHRTGRVRETDGLCAEKWSGPMAKQQNQNCHRQQNQNRQQQQAQQKQRQQQAQNCQNQNQGDRDDDCGCGCGR